MPKPTADPGCPIFDKEGNVRVDEDGHVHVSSETMSRRHPVVYNQNGSIKNDYLSINVKAVTVAAAFVAALATIVGTTYATVVWVAAPHFREAIYTQTAPLRLDIEAESKRMNEHLLREAEKQQQFPTREDLRANQAELKLSLDRLESQIIELRRNR